MEWSSRTPFVFLLIALLVAIGWYFRDDRIPIGEVSRYFGQEFHQYDRSFAILNGQSVDYDVQTIEALASSCSDDCAIGVFVLPSTYQLSVLSAFCDRYARSIPAGAILVAYTTSEHVEQHHEILAGCADFRVREVRSG